MDLPEHGRPREAVLAALHTPLHAARPGVIVLALPAPNAPPTNSPRSLTVRIECEAGTGTVLSTMPKIDELRAHSPIAGGSSSPSNPLARKRPVDRGVTRVPRKLSRAEGVSVPTNLDPRLMTIGVCLMSRECICMQAG